VPADLSHLNEASFWDVCDRTTMVPFASHSNARAVTDIPRNLLDKQLEAIASRGGVVGLNFYEGFTRRSGKKGRADREDLIAHVDHIFDRVGAGVVGIGSDFDGGFGPDKCVKGFERPAHFHALAGFLAERGYSDEDVTGILGGNFLAYLERVWKEAP
jgi:membrane dipeptidase